MTKVTNALNVQTGQFEEVTTPTSTIHAALELQLLRQKRTANFRNRLGCHQRKRRRWFGIQLR